MLHDSGMVFLIPMTLLRFSIEAHDGAYVFTVPSEYVIAFTILTLIDLSVLTVG